MVTLILAVAATVGLGASVFAGYTMLYTNNVVRPGKQIDRSINDTQSVAISEDPAARLAGPARPSFKFNGSDFWAQGVNVGLEYKW